MAFNRYSRTHRSYDPDMWTSRIDLESLKNGAGGMGFPSGPTRHPLWVYKGTVAAILPVVLITLIAGALLLLVMLFIGAVAFGLLAMMSRLTRLLSGPPAAPIANEDDGRRNVRVLE